MELEGAKEAEVVLVGHPDGCMVFAPVAWNHPEIAASIYIGPEQWQMIKS
jgi:hypothetical protein